MFAPPSLTAAQREPVMGAQNRRLPQSFFARARQLIQRRPTQGSGPMGGQTISSAAQIARPRHTFNPGRIQFNG